jgi:hypothetical protein
MLVAFSQGGCQVVWQGGCQQFAESVPRCASRARSRDLGAALGGRVSAGPVCASQTLGEGGKRYSFSDLCRLLLQAPPLLLFDPALAPCQNALFQAAAHDTGSNMAMLSLAFAVGDDTRTCGVNEKDSQGSSPLLLASRSGNFDIAEMLVAAHSSTGLVRGGQTQAC